MMVPCSARKTRVRGRSPLSEETLTKGGSTGASAPPTGPRTPVATQDPAASSGALHAAAASIRTPSPAGRRHRPSASWPGRTSAATTAASTSPAAAIASEIPGHPTTRLLASSELSSIRLTATETSRPSRATDQPAMTRNRRAVSSSAASAARARPPVTQNGGRPGPPGESSSSDRAGRAAVASPGTLLPASRKSSDGWAATSQRPRQQQDRGNHHRDPQVEQHAPARPAEDHGGEQGRQDGDDPDQRHEGGGDRDDQARRPGAPGGPGAGPR